MKIPVTIPFLAVMLSAGILFNQAITGAETKAPKSSKSEPQIITDKNIVAMVNGQKITKQELYNLLIDTYGEDALDVLIRRTLICQSAEKEGIRVTDAEVEQKLKDLINNEIDGLLRTYRIKDKTKLEKELARAGTILAKLE